MVSNKCCVPGCTKSAASKFGVSQNMMSVWENIIGCPLNRNSRVCANYFKPSDITSAWESGNGSSQISLSDSVIESISEVVIQDNTLINDESSISLPMNWFCDVTTNNRFVIAKTYFIFSPFQVYNNRIVEKRLVILKDSEPTFYLNEKQIKLSQVGINNYDEILNVEYMLNIFVKVKVCRGVKTDKKVKTSFGSQFIEFNGHWRHANCLNMIEDGASQKFSRAHKTIKNLKLQLNNIKAKISQVSSMTLNELIQKSNLSDCQSNLVNEMFNDAKVTSSEKKMLSKSDNQRKGILLLDELDPSKPLVKWEHFSEVFRLDENKLGKILENEMKWLDSWESKVIDGLISSNEFLTQQTADGLRVTIKSSIELSKICWTIRFFGIIRQVSGPNDHPSTPTFLQLYRMLTVSSLIKPPKSGNYTIDEVQKPVLEIRDFKDLISNESLREEKIKNMKSKLDLIIEEKNWECEDIFLEHDYTKSSVFECVVYYLGGYLARRREIKLNSTAWSARYLGTGSNFSTLHFEFLIGISTLSNILRQTCDIIWKVLQPIEMAQPTIDDLLDIAAGYFEKAQFPNCVGAVDGKHICLECPKNSRTLKVTVMSSNDQCLVKKLYGNNLNLPPKICLSGDDNGVPQSYVMFADEAFALHTNLMRPFPGRSLNDDRRIFSITVEHDVAVAVTKACCVLHNFVQRKDGLNNDDILSCTMDDLTSRRGTGNPPINAKEVREYFVKYFNTPQYASKWQKKVIGKKYCY
ncbi:hypothetical protein AGLY_009006 [Aphis glycines]|uniref:Transposable element P transposase-like RNase H C-terminal domain-containing protein n=1 Tax=Aphis glycines TaxID=307491 RepID=A0A6G0TIX8_APHGL|nr:hypothetical protein AGLY_009006 [Aphis glycines]